MRLKSFMMKPMTFSRKTVNNKIDIKTGAYAPVLFLYYLKPETIFPGFFLLLP